MLLLPWQTSTSICPPYCCSVTCTRLVLLESPTLPRTPSPIQPQHANLPSARAALPSCPFQSPGLAVFQVEMGVCFPGLLVYLLSPGPQRPVQKFASSLFPFPSFFFLSPHPFFFFFPLTLLSFLLFLSFLPSTIRTICQVICKTKTGPALMKLVDRKGRWALSNYID